ncbi:peptidoglycan DD-metalloendopeptidase family protein [Bacillus mangrovi]|uniref:Peptidoglycan DD-metalloendopeptidase family protein n=1 Tax=Metabacillus mangrovi TaxID=1491830 RepID=A0A7X2V4T8_9BACI|nr:M23 family metallopeptidase [Metabacillus mangrovi]MTH54132.1 peptidoglycan DD-metalloendopeptidase family protein [Metabacillus mangrovi]
MDKGHKSRIKYTLACGVMVSSFMFGSQTASAVDQVSAVYHLYIDGKKLGTVDNKKIIEEAESAVVDREEDRFKKEGIELTVQDLEVVPEMMFRPFADNQKAKEKLESEMEVAAKAHSLVIDGKTAASFRSKEEAEKAWKDYLHTFIPEDQLKAFEEHQKSGKPFEPIKEGVTRITNIEYAAAPEFKEEKVDPGAVRTASEGTDALKKGTENESLYQVKDGDSLEAIADYFGMPLDELLKLNEMKDSKDAIKPDDQIKVVRSAPFTEVKVTEESSKLESIPFDEERKENAELPKGEEQVSQKGENGEALRERKVYRLNGQVVSEETNKDEKKKDPVKQVVQIGTKETSKGDGSLAWPAVGGEITSKMGERWGREHKGIDIAGVQDRTIKAADNGKVVYAENSGAYGNKIEIDHQNGMKTVYAHLDSISVSEGATVQKGSKIGVMGNTGRSTGMHLHFEVYENGNLKNPLDFVSP